MKHILTIVALVFASSCLGQAPTGEMGNELLAWFPFSNNTFDASGNGNNAVLSGPESFAEGLYGEAIYLSGANYMFIDNLLASGLTEFSCFAMVKLQQNLYADIVGDWGSSFLLRYVPNEGWALNVNGSDGSTQIMSGTTPNWATWNRVGFVHDEEGLRLYVNGEVVASSTGYYFGTMFASSAIMTIGAQENQGTMHGWIDDVKMWSRSLSHDEVNALENNIPNSVGCMDSTACNFSPEVIFDDGSCHFNCLFCNDGTVWNEVTQGCDVANPSDTDFDGCVGMIDLLNLLSVFGTCVEEDPQVAGWSCGDPLEYQGYDYETVLIGDQCWFAENLRATHYQNGDELGSSLEGDSWGETESGAYSIYGEGNGSCGSANPEFDACDASASQEVYGLLYNGHAAMDERNLCPNHWHVGSDADWIALKEQLSEEGFSGQEGAALKTSNGWKNDGGGTDVFGFHAVSGGSRNFAAGSFNYAGEFGRYWTSTMSDDGNGWRRSFAYNNSLLERYDGSLNTGSAVRCIKNDE